MSLFTSNAMGDAVAMIRIGRAKAGSGKTFEVKWGQVDHEVYVYYSSDWKYIG